MRAAGPLVLRFKDEVDGIFAPNESSATGMAEVLKSQGYNKKVLVMGFDASKPLLDAIREGDIVGSILQDPYRMGYTSTWYCVRRLQGHDINDGGREMSESTGEYLITKDNLDSDFTRGLYDPEYQARRDTREFRYGAKVPVKGGAR
jgi:ribose transport system substrate-binding protein